MNVCPKCGKTVSATDVFCNACGTKLSHGKSKLIAILLAVFLTFFTWLYTYKRDWWKFWSGLVLSALPGFIAAIFVVFYISDVAWLPDDVLIFLSSALPLTVWALAIIDSAVKNSSWYENY
jgi:hypothetical protein